MHSAFQNAFAAYGEIAADWPWVLLCLSLVVLASLSYGVSLYQEEADLIDLWTAKNAQFRIDMDAVNEVFGELNIAENFYVVVKNEPTNILTPAAFAELIKFEKGLWDVTTTDGHTLGDLCVKAGAGGIAYCLRGTYPLEFLLQSDGSFDEGPLASNAALLARVNSGRGTADFYPPGSERYIEIDRMFGSTTPTDATTAVDGTNSLAAAEAVTWTLYLEGELSREELRDFDSEVEAYAERFNSDSEYVKVVPYTATAIERQYMEAAREDLSILIFAILLVGSYSCLVLGRLNTYESRMLVSTFGILNALVAFIEAIGFCSYLGIPGNMLTYCVPLLLLGVGVDDMYVMVMTLQKAPADYDVQSKIRYTTMTSGVSITITSLTNIAGFVVGAYTQLPALETFAYYAAAGVFFDYFNQLTFFLACLVWDVRRSEKSCGDCCGLFFCKPTSKICCGGKITYNIVGEGEEPLHSRVCRNYTKFLMKPAVRVLVCLIVLPVFVFYGYESSQARLDFNIEDSVLEEFQVAEAIGIRNQYYPQDGNRLSFFSLGTDFQAEVAQQHLLELTGTLDTSDDWVMTGTVISWYSYFRYWVGQGRCLNTGGIVQLTASSLVPADNFDECLKQWLSDKAYILFASSLAFDDDGHLAGAMLSTDTWILDSLSDNIEAMNDARDIAESGPGRSFPLSAEFGQYELYETILPESIVQFSLCLTLVFIVIVLTIGDVMAASLALLPVALTCLGQFSALCYLEEGIDAAHLFYILVGIGVSVDYSTHIIHAFISTEKGTRAERSAEAMQFIGWSVFNGIFSMFLAVVLSFFGRTRMMIMFTKCWVLHSFFGLLHSLVLLPVLLSILGPVINTPENSHKVYDSATNLPSVSTPAKP